LRVILNMRQLRKKRTRTHLRQPGKPQREPRPQKNEWVLLL